MPVSLTREEAYAFLRSRPSKLVITTIGANGYPHSVPTDYIVIEEDIYVVGRAKAQRVKNVGRNPHVSAVVDSGNTRQTFEGLLIQGDAAIINDAQTVLGILQEVARQRGSSEDELPTKAWPGLLYIRINPTRLISWDYSRGPARTRFGPGKQRTWGSEVEILKSGGSQENE